MRNVVLSKKPSCIHLTGELDHFVLSTYELLDNERCGSLILFKDDNIFKEKVLNAGVFRFSINRSLIYALLTNGSVAVVSGFDKAEEFNLLEVEKDRILLDISFQDERFVTSDNSGHIHIFDTLKGKQCSFLGHKLPYSAECEVWSVIWHEGLIVSGGEDGLMKIWDERCGFARPVTINRSHNCGITIFYQEASNVLLTGSYDDRIRRIDLRNPLNEATVKQLPGGVWSIKEFENTGYLVSCMYGGWVVVERSNFDSVLSNEKLGKFLLYDSIYSHSTIISCTFNDYMVHFEKIE